MRSKIFSFNFSIYRKNILLYWPIWLGYQLVLLLCLPVQLWMNFGYYERYIAPSASLQEKQDAMLNYLSSGLNSVSLIGAILVPIFVVITVMALLGFLFFQKNANMMHAYPVTRGELYHTSLVSALTFVLVPEVITFVVTVFVCLINQVSCVEYVAMWLLMVMGASILYIAIAFLGAMLTGNVFGVVVIFLIINLLYSFVREVMGLVLYIFSYGMTTYNSYADHTFLVFSPIVYMSREIGFRTNYVDVGKKSYIDSLTLYGGSVIIWYVVSAIVLFAISYLMYRKRPVEKAGDVVVFSGMKPVFRWGVGICGAYIVMGYLYAIFEETGIVVAKLGLLCILLISGIVAFCLAEMIIQKNFRIRNRKIMKEFGIYALALVASFVVVLAASKCVERYQPKVEDIEKVSMRLSYQVEEEGEHIKDIVAIQSDILAHAKQWKEEIRGNREYTNLMIKYVLKNGMCISREYRIPLTESGLQMIAKVKAYEEVPERFVKGILGDYSDSSYSVKGHICMNYQYNEDFGDQKSKALLEAIWLDAREGTIQKYNLINENGTWEYLPTKYASSLDFELISQENRKNPATYDVFTGEYFETRSYYSVSFGTDCAHVLQALIDTGVISSKKELILYSDYEEALNSEMYEEEAREKMQQEDLEVE